MVKFPEPKPTIQYKEPIGPKQEDKNGKSMAKGKGSH